MQKWMLTLAIGGLVTWFVYSKNKMIAYIIGGITLALTYYNYNK